jgi:hypothetical protein
MLYILNEYYYKVINNIQKCKEVLTKIKGDDKNICKDSVFYDDEDIYGYDEDVNGYDGYEEDIYDDYRYDNDNENNIYEDNYEYDGDYDDYNDYDDYDSYDDEVYEYEDDIYECNDIL